MDKNKIINYLTEKFLKEEATPGLDLTNQVKKESGKINKDAIKAIEKDVQSYDKEIKKNADKTKMPANKFNYNGDKEKEYHDEMEIMNGQEMIQYDREPNQDFKDRAKEAIAGSSRMGNKAGEGTANAEPVWGASSADFGKNLVKKAADSAKKRQDAEYKIISFGDDIETVPKGSKPMSKFSAFVKEGIESKNVLGKALKVGDILSANSKKIKSIDTTTAGRVKVTTTDNDTLDFDAQKEYGVNLVTPVTENEDEIADRNIANNNPYGSEKEKAFYDKENQGDSKYNLTPIRNHANDYNGYTHFAIHKLSNAIVMPFDYSDMMPKKPVPTANTTPRAKAIYKQKLDEYKQEMKRVQAELNQFKKDYFIDEIRDEIDYLLDAPFKASDYTIVTKDGLAKYGIDLNNFMLFKGDINSTPEADIQENKNNTKPQIKEGMKRLNFKKEFNGVGNALKMIPESYRVDNKVFEMTDGNESYKIRWEGTLTEGKAVVLTASNKTMVNEDMQKMKHLMGYKSQETLGTVKGKARLNENAVFGDILNKTKALLEGEDIEDQNAPEKDADKVISQAKEAKKDVEGSVSTEKGTQAPAPKTGSMESLDDAKSQAKEAKEHVEGSVESKLGLGLGVKTKEGNWNEISVPQAADAKKHVTMNEGVTLGESYFAPMDENMYEEMMEEGMYEEGMMDEEWVAPEKKEITLNDILEKLNSAVTTEDGNQSDALIKSAIKDLGEKIKTMGQQGLEKGADYLRKKLGGPVEEGMYEGEGYSEQYYVAIADMDEPGEADAHIVSSNDVHEYEQNGWDLRGPFSEEEASEYLEKINQSNRNFRYYDSMDDREGKSNLYIDPLDKFEKGSLDTNW